MKNNIILCGFSGSGKTTVGMSLAKRLGVSFYDSDAYVEQTENRSVSEIFRVDGEHYFRTLENNAVESLAKMHNVVIAVGGGAVVDNNNVQCLKKSGCIFYLKADFDNVKVRLQGDTTRPLLQNGDILKLMQKRTVYYCNIADFIIDANESVENTIKQILDILEELK